LNDYIYASNRGSGTYTARVTKENLDVAGYPSPISLTFQKVYSPKKRWTFSTIVVLQRYLNLKKFLEYRVLLELNGKVKRISMF
jgi:hypothetical protein